MVNKDAVQDWVNALRSDNYNQIDGQLKLIDGDSTAFCCLGVACDRYDNSLWDDEDYIVDEETRSGSLPIKVSFHYGFVSDGSPESDPYVTIPHKLMEKYALTYNSEALSYLNDGLGFTFDEIADCIEYTYLPEDWEARNAK